MSSQTPFGAFWFFLPAALVYDRGIAEMADFLIIGGGIAGASVG